MRAHKWVKDKTSEEGGVTSTRGHAVHGTERKCKMNDMTVDLVRYCPLQISDLF